MQKFALSRPANPAKSSLERELSGVAEGNPSPSLTAKLSSIRTASAILATFSLRKQSTHKALPCHTSPSAITITMTDRRDLRQTQRVTYEISSESEHDDVSSTVDSTFSTPQKPKRTRHITDLDDLDEDELEEIKPTRTPPPRVSLAGHSLRQHKDLQQSSRSLENADKPIKKKRRISRVAPSKSKLLIGSNAPNHPRTERNEVRDIIATETATKRARFFIAKKEYFLPLLPEGNHISKLVEQKTYQGIAEGLISPYEAIQTQPKGYDAIRVTMQLILIRMTGSKQR